MSESLETIGREFAQSQKRSEERRAQPRRRDSLAIFASIIAILLVVATAIFGVLVVSGAIKI